MRSKNVTAISNTTPLAEARSTVPASLNSEPEWVEAVLELAERT